MVNEKLKELAKKPTKKTRKPVKDTYFRFKTKLKKSKDVKAILSSVVGILTYGIPLSLVLALFGVDISLITIIGSGCLAYLFEIKFLDMLTSILSSIKLVQVNR